MALSIIRPSETRAERITAFEVTPDSSYVSGGYPLGPSDVGFQSIKAVVVHPVVGHAVRYDHLAGTLQFLVPNTLLEVAGGTNLSSVPAFRVTVFGS